MILALTLAAALLIGLALGLLGGGGSILTLPVLVYLAGIAPKPAIAMSLFVVAVTSAVSVLPHARAGRVRWRTALLFGVAGMVGAYGGGRLAEYVPAGLLLVGFGVLMLAAAIAMIRGRRGGAATDREASAVLMALLGAAVGLVTGMVGAGGGFVIVPALTLLAGLPMAAAVGTSLLVIALQSTAGFLGHVHSVAISWPLTISLTVIAVVGSLLGARLAGRVSQERLRTGFGWFLVVMSGLVLVEQAPAGVRHWLFASPAGWVVLAVMAAVVVAAVATGIRRRQRERQHERVEAPVG